MRLTLRALASSLALLATAVLWPDAALAQAPLRAESPWTETVVPELAPQPAPSSSAARYAEWLQPADAAEPAVQRRGKKKETGVTLMIVGGAAFVTGIIIGDTGGTILAVAGIGVGAYGVYLFVE